MLGFSIYLSQEPDEATHHYIQQMQAAGFRGVFTSLHIPEDDPTTLTSHLDTVTTWCHEVGLKVMADISAAGLKRLGWSLTQPEMILRHGVDGLRIDDGIDLTAVAQLSHAMPVALNASTLTQADVDTLRANQADFTHLEAWHNYYPRPDTGLDRNWYRRKNAWLHELGLTTMGFIPGDGQLRGPLYQHLPMIEQHRSWSPLASLVDLAGTDTDRIYVADPTITSASQKAIARYINDQQLTLQVTDLPVLLKGQVWHNRPDVAANVVRLTEGRIRQLLPTKPRRTLPRPMGTLTLDNENYGRYAGELQLTKVDLPADEAVNVIGEVRPQDVPLLQTIGPNQAIILIETEQ